MLQQVIKTTLGEHISTQKGYAFKSSWYTKLGHPIVKVSDFTDYDVDTTSLTNISEDIAKDYLKFKLEIGDVVIQTVGSWINNPQSVVGKVIRIPKKAAGALLNQNAVKIIPTSKMDKKYLFYLLRDNSFKNYIIGTAQGAANQASITLDSIKQFSFFLFPIEVQRKTAAILSAYDDLIENNSRRIQILEEMARMIYQEWFVKFRFPGYEKIKFVESPKGMIPEGWEVVSFTSIADVLSGGTPKTTEPTFWNGKIPFFTPTDGKNNFYILATEKYITELGLSKCNSKLYSKDTVFITARGTVGKVIMPAVSMAMNQSCYALVGKSGITQQFLFLLVIDSINYLKKNTGGATFETIVVDTFHRFNIIKPLEPVIKSFTETVKPLFDGILNLLRRNMILQQTRDLLLPKLISGQIDVSDLDIQT